MTTSSSSSNTGLNNRGTHSSSSSSSSSSGPENNLNEICTPLLNNTTKNLSSNSISASQQQQQQQASSIDNSNNKNNQTIIKEQHPIKLRVKCTAAGENNTNNDYEVLSHTTASVSQLKESIRRRLGDRSRGRYLRVIASGRLLAPDTAKLEKFNIKDNDVIHAVLAASGVRGGMQAAMSRGLTIHDGRPERGASGISNRRRRLNNGSGITSSGLIAPLMNSDSSDSDDDEDDLESGNGSNNRQRLGFDRLRTSGLSRAEIGTIRLYFSSHVDQFIETRERERRNNSNSNTSNSSSTNNNNSDNNNDQTINNNTSNSTAATTEDDQSPELSRLERLRMEDAWMATQGPHSEFRLNLNSSNPLFTGGIGGMTGVSPYRTPGTLDYHSNQVGTDRDFLWGFILGFSVGFFMLFWVWMPTVPHKQKLGILAGISFHTLLSSVENAEQGED